MTAPSRFPSSTRPEPAATREWQIQLADKQATIERTGRLKLDGGWLMITDSDDDGPFVVFAAPAESVLYVEPAA